MFFQKKKEELGDQFAVFQEREAPRYSTDGGISLEGFEGEGLLKNVSVSGCCMDSVTYAAIIPDEAYQARVNPGSGLDIKPFTITLKASWTKSSEMVFEAGFSLEEGQRDSSLERYVDLLKKQGVKPEYGNMKRPSGKH